TIKVLDLIIGLTGEGPAHPTQPLATRSYEISLIECHFGHGPPLSNILILIALAFSLVHLRANPRAPPHGCPPRAPSPPPPVPPRSAHSVPVPPGAVRSPAAPSSSP